MDLVLNGKNNIQKASEKGSGLPVEQRLMEYVRSIKEEGMRGESKEAYASRVYAKARSGQRLTPDEMNFLARTDPGLYRKVLRAQMARKELESRLKSCRSKQDAQDVFAAALNSISDKDPDRDMILQALRQAFGEFVESGEYQRLPDKGEEEEKNRDGRKMLEFVKNESGYQEAYQMNGGRTAFAADA